MPTVIAHHDVKDTKHWLASPKREEVFGPLGVTNIRTFVDPQNPTHVALLMDVADMDAVMAYMQTEPAAEAMEYDGVLPVDARDARRGVDRHSGEARPPSVFQSAAPVAAWSQRSALLIQQMAMP